MSEKTRVEETKAAALAALKNLDKALAAASKLETEIVELTGRIGAERQTRLSAAADAVIAGKASQQGALAGDDERRLKELSDVRPFLQVKIVEAADAARPFVRAYMGAVQSVISADEARLTHIMLARMVKDANLLGAVLGDQAAYDTFGTGTTLLCRRVGEAIMQRARHAARHGLGSHAGGQDTQKVNSLPPDMLGACVLRADQVWNATREIVAAVEAGAAVTEAEVKALKA